MSEFAIERLRAAYDSGDRTPTDVIETHLGRVNDGPAQLWIHTVEPAILRDKAAALEEMAADSIDWDAYPLYGIPFAIKDNIDYAGTPTTAGCPAYEHVPESTAAVVTQLREAGAILVGKTNLDQFATGLVGTRSPYGACPNAIDSTYISGGSSSGSGVAVASEQVAFALGTDTAGSGRVPAALNGIVGLKPSRGVLSNRGVVPACKSLDCVAIFANSCRDALTVERVAAGFDPKDAYSQRDADTMPLSLESLPEQPVIGIPEQEQLTFFDDAEARDCFAATVSSVDEIFSTQAIDLQPFIDAGRLLYQGPWVAERLAAIQDFLLEHPDALLETTRSIIARGRDFDAVDAYTAEYKLRRLARKATTQLKPVTAIITPTTGTTYTRAAIEEKPVERNSNLGYYTNFMNLLNLSAIAIPGGRYESGLPFGITMFADRGQDALLASLADHYCYERDVSIGASGAPYRSIRDSELPNQSTAD
jgi:allophanate hydrolase